MKQRRNRGTVLFVSLEETEGRFETTEEGWKQRDGSRPLKKSE
jgi:hypothetical protein